MSQEVAVRKNISTRCEKSNIWKKVKTYRLYYILMLPGLIYFLIYKYLPMAGVVIAFKDVMPFDGLQGILKAPWVGFENFRLFLGSKFFFNIMGNTLAISVYNLIFGFPAPIIFALLLNEVTARTFKKMIQSVSYLPHFLSIVIVCGMVFNILSPTGGLVNEVIKMFGGEPIYFVGSKEYIRGVIVGSTIWQDIGWSSIIYLAAMTGVPEELYEAATIDGANVFQKIWNVTLPGIMFTVSIMFILAIGKILDAGFERVLLLYSPGVYSKADIIDTYVYRTGITDLRYSYSAAVGLFKSVFSLLLVLITNRAAKKMGQSSLW